MQLDLCERLVEPHHVGKGPLVCPQLAHRRGHEDGAQLVNDEYLGDVERVGPEDSKLLGASLAIKLGEVLSITDDHDIENAVVGRTYRLGLLLPDFKDLGALLKVYDCIGPVCVLAEHVHVPIDELQLLYVVPGRQ